MTHHNTILIKDGSSRGEHMQTYVLSSYVEHRFYTKLGLSGTFSHPGRTIGDNPDTPCHWCALAKVQP